MTQAAESLIIAELLKQRAITAGLTETSSDTNADSDIEQNVETLLQQELETPEVSDEECQRYYEANQHKFKTAPLVEAKHILIAADPQNVNDRAQAQTLTDNLLKQLENNTSQFASLAKQYSACPSKEMGGNLGQISHGQTVPEFQRQLFAATTGLMQKPVETRYGFHIVLVERKIEGKTLPYQQVKERISEFLKEKIQRNAIAQYIHELVAEADIQGYVFNAEASPLVQ